MRFERTEVLMRMRYGLFSLVFFACQNPSPSAGPPRVPNVRGPTIPAGDIAADSAKVVSLDNGAQILVRELSGKYYFTVEGTLSDAEYEGLRARGADVRAAIEKTLSKLQAVGAVPAEIAAEAGYFTFLLPYNEALLSPLKHADLPYATILAPVPYTPDNIDAIRALTPVAKGTPQKIDPADYSGLEAVGVPKFVQRAERDIGSGVRVRGDSTRIGVADTGITLNHPTFLSERGENRIVYMREFTPQGCVYFSPAARFEANVPADGAEDALEITAEVLKPSRFEPAGDDLALVENARILVSPELRARLLTPGSGARLGLYYEMMVFGVDFNHNGRTDDQLPVILLPGATPEEDVVYFDPAGLGDFRTSPALGTWNLTQETMTVFSEQAGFDLAVARLPTKDGSRYIDARSAAIVGFDPGNHGSHVASIAAGARTFANDPAGTLARGVAPEAFIAANRVCANGLGCHATLAFIDLVINAGVDVVNMSLGMMSPFNDGYGVEETIINRLSAERNVLFVIAAGNDGPVLNTVATPSVARLALSVGASATRAMIERQYQGNALNGEPADAPFILFFSSRGPAAGGGFKPNLVAPGTAVGAIALNTVDGLRAGLDAYWGTSMASPFVAGGYALLLDAARKYNAAHAERPIPTDALTLRRVLIESAQRIPHVSWAEQGTGHIDLVAAWELLLAMGKRALPTAVNLRGQRIELDYEVLTSVPVRVDVPDSARELLPYDHDGRHRNEDGEPIFAGGLHLNYDDAETFKQVGIKRKLPPHFAAGPDAGELARQINTTRDDFVLETVMFGSDTPWIKAGVLAGTPCAQATASKNLSVIGSGVDVWVPPGSPAQPARLVIYPDSALNVCVDKVALASLPPGDHGALVFGYRTVAGQVSPVASFVLPIFVSVPHHVFADSTGFAVEDSVHSHETKRYRIDVPAGVTHVAITLETPNDDCSSAAVFVSEGLPNLQMRTGVSSCQQPPAGFMPRQMTISAPAVLHGVYDVTVLGAPTSAVSTYKLKVDYLKASTSVPEIVMTGGELAPSTTFEWDVSESSSEGFQPSPASFAMIDRLERRTPLALAPGQTVTVNGVDGPLRRFSGGELIGLGVFATKPSTLVMHIVTCAASAIDLSDPSCVSAPQRIPPSFSGLVLHNRARADHAYGLRVEAIDMMPGAQVEAAEQILGQRLSGGVSVTGGPQRYSIRIGFEQDSWASHPVVKSPLFRPNGFDVRGMFALVAENGGGLLVMDPLRVKAAP